MSLRYRLFLWIASLFLLAGAATYVLEIFITSKQMEKAREQLKAKIIKVNERKRESIQKFLAETLGDEQARMDVLLRRLSSYPLQAAAFAPTQFNYENGTWLFASQVINNNKWIDFIQNTNQGKLASLIIPRVSAMDSSYRLEINDDLAWIIMGDQEKHSEPYLGVRLRFNMGEASPHFSSQEHIETTGQVPKAYLLFNWRQLFCPDQNSFDSLLFRGIVPQIKTNLTVPWADGSKLDLNKFFTSFQMARDYVTKGLGKTKEDDHDTVRMWIESQFQNFGQDLNTITIPKDLLKNLPSPFVRKELDILAMRYDQFYLIWCLTVMNEVNIFGGDLFSSGAPHGIVVHFGKSPYGEGLHTRDVFFQKAAFDDASYYKSHLPPGSSSNLDSHVAIFQPFNLPHVFFGNIAEFKVLDAGVQKTGYVTVGMDTDLILQKLVLAAHETALLVTGGKVLGGASDTGAPFNVGQELNLPLQEMVTNKSGTITWGEDQFYYITMTPFSYLDLHFILLNPFAKEFALLNSLTKSTEKIVDSLLMNIHLIGILVVVLAILILHYLSHRITDPIAKLARATCEIGEGHLEDIEIPVPSEKDTDEVASLCRSFDQMVKGLKEKEKVKAVLNKVVSQEIAHEILKGNVRLGGEEKKVSILFADIRNFTAMTQNMEPKEVVDLLNVCMTKISHFVDQHGGVIDKYVGDEAMALFGAPVECHESAYKAILSAIGMIEALKKWNEQRTKMHLVPIEMGVGIHTGNVLAGNMGAENRLNYTVLGSNVNLAARLCSSAGPMEILISDATLNEPLVKDKIFYEEMPPLTLKGFDIPVVVYRVKGFR